MKKTEQLTLVITDRRNPNEEITITDLSQAPRQQPNWSTRLPGLPSVSDAATLALFIRSFSQAGDMSYQIRGNYAARDQLKSIMSIASLGVAIGGAINLSIVNPILGTAALITTGMGMALKHIEITADATKREVANNNVRMRLGLEATNFSRYRGIRR